MRLKRGSFGSLLVWLRRGSFAPVTTVVKNGQFWVVISVVKKNCSLTTVNHPKSLWLKWGLFNHGY